LHNFKYDYSKTVYESARTKVVIICPDHGDFEQSPESHGRGDVGCRGCRKERVDPRAFTTGMFIQKARNCHGDKYDYSKTEYKNALERVVIFCRKHGAFDQMAASHLQGHEGCPHCAKTKVLTTETFIRRSRKKHGDRYDYSKTTYINNRTKVAVGCYEHGEFEQNPRSHMKGMVGCLPCRRRALSLTTEIFIQRSREHFGNRFDYTKTNYVDSASKVQIVCKKHGEFWQFPKAHMHGMVGCPKCRKVC